MKRIAYYVNDLLFTSKIREVATQLGFESTKVTSLDTIGDLTQVHAVLLDLRRPEALRLLDQIRAASPHLPCIGFVDHELTDVMKAARERGCAAYAKGKFSSELPELLRALGERSGETL